MSTFSRHEHQRQQPATGGTQIRLPNTATARRRRRSAENQRVQTSRPGNKTPKKLFIRLLVGEVDNGRTGRVSAFGERSNLSKARGAAWPTP